VKNLLQLNVVRNYRDYIKSSLPSCLFLADLVNHGKMVNHIENAGSECKNLNKMDFGWKQFKASKIDNTPFK
jgi:hypothetical protein